MMIMMKQASEWNFIPTCLEATINTKDYQMGGILSNTSAQIPLIDGGIENT
jgi:hypothetical protein